MGTENVVHGEGDNGIEPTSLRDQKIGESLLAALMAEGRNDDWELERFCQSVVGLTNETMSVATWALDKSGRAIYKPGGLLPAAGTFPLTAYEYMLQAELVRPAATELDRHRVFTSNLGCALRARL